MLEIEHYNVPMARQRPPTLQLEALNEEYAVCRFAADAALPTWAEGEFVAITRTREELSITCPAYQIPSDIQKEGGWTCFKVAGPLDFAEIGVLSALAAPLATAGISIFVVSTFDTDYLLVKSAARQRAVAALTDAGHTIRPGRSERTPA